MNTQQAIDAFHVPLLVKGNNREYYKLGAVAMARFVAEQTRFECDALNAVVAAADAALSVGQVTGNSKSNLTSALAALAALRTKESA